MRRGTAIPRSIESFYGMLGRGAQKRRRENFPTFAGKKKSPSPPASRFIMAHRVKWVHEEKHPAHEALTTCAGQICYLQCGRDGQSEPLLGEGVLRSESVTAGTPVTNRASAEGTKSLVLFCD